MRLILCCLILLAPTAAHAEQVMKLPPQPKLTAEAAAAVGDARLVSFRVEDEKTAPDYTLNIVRLSKAGHTVLSSTKIAYDGKETWLDAHTLANVSVDVEKKEYTLQYFVDGVVDPKRTVKGALAFKLKKGQELPTLTSGYRSAKSELFLRGCLDADGSSECPKPVWMRIDGAKPGPVNAPKGAVEFTSSHEKNPSVKPPRELTVKLTKITSKFEKKKIPAIACTKAGATTNWSYESMEDSGEIFLPKKVSWILVDPPIYGATGTHYNPVGWESTTTYFFRACESREMSSFGWLGGGLWEDSSYTDASIKINAGKDPVAAFKGTVLLAAPAK
jgi:hypothetical protein